MAIFFFAWACGALICREVPLLRLRRAKRARGFGLLFLQCALNVALRCRARVQELAHKRYTTEQRNFLVEL